VELNHQAATFRTDCDAIGQIFQFVLSDCDVNNSKKNSEKCISDHLLPQMEMKSKIVGEMKVSIILLGHFESCS
jgi:hypothetical protein